MAAFAHAVLTSYATSNIASVDYTFVSRGSPCAAADTIVAYTNVADYATFLTSAHSYVADHATFLASSFVTACSTLVPMPSASANVASSTAITAAI